MHKNLLKFSLIGILFVACTKDLPQENVINVVAELEVHLSQVVGPTGPFAEFIISTVDSVSCKNAELKVVSKANQSRFQLDIIGVEVTGLCAQGTHKPMTFKSLAIPESEIGIVIDIKNSLKSTGRIKVTADGYCLTMNEHNGLVIPNTCIKRIQPGTCWGIVEANHINDLAKMKSILQTHEVQEFSFPQGNYGLFEVGDNAKVTLVKQQNQQSHFTYKYMFYFKLKDWQAFKTEFESAFAGDASIQAAITDYYGRTLRF
ncbi:MAG: hypothetical protein IPN29_10865 [Saprospiraceae bacterium]|nr:hypothetical protein [Saprospiraceae bacterium]